MPVASAISTHTIRASHPAAAKGVGGRSQGDANGSAPAPNFGDLLRGQAGVVSQPVSSGAAPKQASAPVSGQVAEKTSSKAAEQVSGKTNGAADQITGQGADQIQEAVKAKPAAQADSLSAQLQALLESGTQSADADNVNVATTDVEESKALGKVKKDDSAKAALPGVDAGDSKAVKEKSRKEGKSDGTEKADKTIAVQTSTENLLQVSVQAALPAVSVPVSAPVLSALQKPRAEGKAPARAANTSAPGSKTAPAGQARQSAKTAAVETAQGAPKSAALPMPDLSAAPDGQPTAGDATKDVTGNADSADFSDRKSAGKPDADAITAKASSEIASQTKHLDSPVPTDVHAAQVAQAVVGGTSDTAGHLSTMPQNLAPASSPAVGTLHGAGMAAASPYDRIDQGAAPVVLHAGARQVAVGVHDPSLGWVEIKTQSAAGHVDATLVASSAQSHDALATQLPAISQFLEQRDVRVGTLVVNHQSAGSGANHFGSGSGQHAGPGYGGNGGSGGNGGNGSGERHGPHANAPVPAPRRSVPVTATGGENGAPARPLSYISVRA